MRQRGSTTNWTAACLPPARLRFSPVCPSFFDRPPVFARWSAVFARPPAVSARRLAAFARPLAFFARPHSARCSPHAIDRALRRPPFASPSSPSIGLRAGNNKRRRRCRRAPPTRRGPPPWQSHYGRPTNRANRAWLLAARLCNVTNGAPVHRRSQRGNTSACLSPRCRCASRRQSSRSTQEARRRCVPRGIALAIHRLATPRSGLCHTPPWRVRRGADRPGTRCLWFRAQGRAVRLRRPR